MLPHIFFIKPLRPQAPLFLMCADDIVSASVSQSSLLLHRWTDGRGMMRDRRRREITSWWWSISDLTSNMQGKKRGSLTDPIDCSFDWPHYAKLAVFFKDLLPIKLEQFRRKSSYIIMAPIKNPSIRGESTLHRLLHPYSKILVAYCESGS